MAMIWMIAKESATGGILTLKARRLYDASQQCFVSYSKAAQKARRIDSFYWLNRSCQLLSSEVRELLKTRGIPMPARSNRSNRSNRSSGVMPTIWNMGEEELVPKAALNACSSEPATHRISPIMFNLSSGNSKPA